jgi:hypothetical protein
LEASYTTVYKRLTAAFMASDRKIEARRTDEMPVHIACSDGW